MKALLVFFLLPALSLSEAGLHTTTVVFSPLLKVEAEIAVSDEERAKGLMFRESLSENAGMLFVFQDLDYHGFWMKNTLIPLDILWLNERKEIVYWVTADPCKKDPCSSYSPFQKAKYVLEVAGGFAKKHRLQIGQKLEFNLPL